MASGASQVHGVGSLRPQSREISLVRHFTRTPGKPGWSVNAAASSAAASAGPPAPARPWPSPSSRRPSSWSCSTRPSSTFALPATSRPHSASPAANLEVGRQRVRAGVRRAACCSAAGPATYWGVAGSSSSASCCSRWPRCSAGSPPLRNGCSARAGLAGGGRSAAAFARAHRPIADRGHLSPEGQTAANRAMGVYAAMSVAGGRGRPDRGRPAGPVPSTGAGCFWGETCRSACWSRFFRDPGATRVGSGAAAPFDLPGAILPARWVSPRWSTGYRAPRPARNGVSHWGDTKVIVSLVASVVLLVAFGFIEVRSKHALVPMRVLRKPQPDRGLPDHAVRGPPRLFGMFFFLTVFVQSVWGYSAPGHRHRLPADDHHGHGGVRDRFATGQPDRRPATAAGRHRHPPTGGMFWLSRITENSHYASGLLGADAGDRTRHGG